MKNYLLLLILPLLVVASCGEDEPSDMAEPNKNPGSFTVTVLNITPSTARLEWSAASDTDGDVVSYAVTLGGIVLSSDLTATRLDISDLDPETSYNGSVIASDGNGGESIATFSFSTPAVEEPVTNEPPGAFTVEVSDISANAATLEWSSAEDPDGDDVTYSVQLGGETLTTDLSNTSFDLSELTPETEYEGIVTASDGNGGESMANFSFTTLAEMTPPMNQDPEDFMVMVTDIAQTTTTLDWDAAVDPDGDDITYDVLLAGSPVATDLAETIYELTGLDPDAVYEGVIVAKDGNGGQSSAFFSFVTLEEVTTETPTIIEDYFNDSFVSMQIVMAQLEDGTMAECYQIAFTGDGVDGDVGPYCPETVNDIGGLAVYDGETNPGLRNINANFLADLEADGWDIVDANGNVNTDDLSGPPSSMNVSTCIHVPYDPNFTFVYLIPVTPKLANSNNVISQIENIGVSVDGTPLTGDPPSATSGPGGMQSGNSSQINFPSIDPCGGHPDPAGYYHAHFIPQVMDQVLAANGITEISCTLFEQTTGTTLAGFAKDGFPVYAYAEMPSDLDDCNGRTAATPEYPDGIYHYVASTTEAPNMPPCLKGVATVESFEIQ